MLQAQISRKIPNSFNPVDVDAQESVTDAIGLRTQFDVLQQRASMRGIRVVETADRTGWQWHYLNERSRAFPTARDSWQDAFITFAFTSPGILVCRSRSFSKQKMLIGDACTGNDCELHEERFDIRRVQGLSPYRVFKVTSKSLCPSTGARAIPIGDARQSLIAEFSGLGIAVEHVAHLLFALPPIVASSAAPLQL